MATAHPSLAAVGLFVLKKLLLAAILLLIELTASCTDTSGPLHSGTSSVAGGVPVGQIEGVVEASVLAEDVRLPGATVTVSLGATQLASVTTGFSGQFSFPKFPAGTYTVAVTRAGFAPLSTSASIFDSDVFLPPLSLAPQSNAVKCRVTTEDDTPTHFSYPQFGVDERATVTLADFNDVPVLGPFSVNDAGRCLIAGVPNGTYTLKAQLGLAVTRTTVTVAGSASVDLLLFNTSPVISVLSAQKAGDDVKTAVPGDVVDVVVEASDAEQGLLSYAWGVSASSVPFVSANAPVVTWHLPASTSVSFIEVLVYDGIAYAHRRLPLRTANLHQANLSGRVLDTSGTPITGARVSVNGTWTLTNGVGFFRLSVAEAPRYAVNVSSFGSKLLSRVTTDPSSLQDYVLPPAEVFSGLSAGSAITVGGTGGVPQLSIPANSLMDPDGVPVSGPVSVSISAIDPFTPDGGFPGDNTGLNDLGQIVRLETYGAVGVDVQDAAGKPLNLKSGASASLVVPRINFATAPPAVVPVWSFDERRGIWQEEPTSAVFSSGNYTFTTSHFSVFNLDLEFNNAACLRVIAEEATLPLKIKVTILAGAGQTFFYTLENTINVLVRLPPNTDVKLESLDSSGNPISDTAVVTNTGAATPDGLDLDPDFPYRDCSVTVHIDGPGPKDGGFLDRITTEPADALLYYDAIDPNDARDTLPKWREANGIGAGSLDEVTAVYFNRGDLSFGRRMSMLRRANAPGEDVAFAVTNYLTVEDAEADVFPIATVAMEFSRHPVNPGARYTKFFVFDETGTRQTFADLDGRGKKYVPGLCLVCHKGEPYNPTDHPDGNVGARFLPFDLDSFGYGALGRAAQEDSFKKLNRAVLEATNATTAIIALVKGWYGGETLPGPFDGSWYPGKGTGTLWDDSAAGVTGYTEALKQYCRSCHTARSSSLDFATHTKFINNAGSAFNDVCSSLVMPHARTTFINLWSDPGAIPALQGAAGTSWTPCPN